MQQPKSTIRLVRHASVFHVADLASYETLTKIGAPALKVSLDDALTLRDLCARNRVKVDVKTFATVELETLDKIQQRWQHPVTKTPKGLLFEIPRSKATKAKLDKLVDALIAFYNRHCFDVIDVKERKTSTRLKLTLEVRRNGNRNPQWKQA